MNKRQKIISCIVFIFIFLVAVKLTEAIMVPPDTMPKARMTINAFYEIPDNSQDVIVYGSSHAWRGFNTEEVYSKYGINIWNYGCYWQAINTTKLFLKDSLISQSPKVAIIETYRVNTVLEDTDMSGEIFYTKYIRNSKAKKEYIHQCLGDDYHRYFDYYFPLSIFHSNWQNLSKDNFEQLLGRSNRYISSRGFSGFSSVTPISIPDIDKMEQLPLDDKAMKELDEIMDICEQNNIQVIFYTAPMSSEYNYSDAMEKYSEDHGCVYFDFYKLKDEINLDETMDFADEGHMNINGANKIANFFGEYLSEHYDL